MFKELFEKTKVNVFTYKNKKELEDVLTEIKSLDGDFKLGDDYEYDEFHKEVGVHNDKLLKEMKFVHEFLKIKPKQSIEYIEEEQ